MPTYSDAEMRTIMGRALQIDSGRSDRFTPEQLRAVAAELGISTQALEVAMYEADSKGVHVQAPAPATRRWASSFMIAVGVLLMIAAGAAVLLSRRADVPHIDRVARAGRATPTPVPVEPVSPSPGPVPKKTTSKKLSAPPQF